MREGGEGAVVADLACSFVARVLIGHKAGDFGLGDLQDGVDGGGHALSDIVLGAKKIHDAVIVVELPLVDVLLGG